LEGFCALHEKEGASPLVVGAVEVVKTAVQVGNLSSVPLGASPWDLWGCQDGGWGPGRDGKVLACMLQVSLAS